eukprot:2036697-Rhodomonas_salina.4
MHRTIGRMLIPLPSAGSTSSRLASPHTRLSGSPHAFGGSHSSRIREIRTRPCAIRYRDGHVFLSLSRARARSLYQHCLSHTRRSIAGLPGRPQAERSPRGGWYHIARTPRSSIAQVSTGQRLASA